MDVPQSSISLTNRPDCSVSSFNIFCAKVDFDTYIYRDMIMRSRKPSFFFFLFQRTYRFVTVSEP